MKVMHRLTPRYWLLLTLTLTWLVICPVQGQEQNQDGNEYFSIIRIARQGDPIEAIQKLEAYIQKYPGDSKSDDALSEIGRLYEEKLGQYDQALIAYDRLLADYPHSRSARRAGHRVKKLRTDRAGGDQPLREYNQILRDYSRLEPLDAIERMKAIVKTYPEFSRLAQANYWIADQYFRLGDYPSAIDWYKRVVDRFPMTQTAFYALRGLGEVHVEYITDFATARLWYSRMIEYESVITYARQSSEQGLMRVDRFELLWRLFYFSLAVCGLTTILLIVRIHWRQRLSDLSWRSMIDLIIYLGLSILLVAVLYRYSPYYAKSLVGLLGGTLGILFLNRMFLFGRLLTIPGKIFHFFVIILLILSLQYIVFYTNDLIEISLDTIKSEYLHSGG